MSDHFDAEGSRTDITDLYAFPVPGRPDRSVLILGVNPELRCEGFRGPGSFDRESALPSGPVRERELTDPVEVAVCQPWRIFQKESFRTINPSRKVQRSHPLMWIRSPSVVVPVSVHSDAPRSPLTKCWSSE